jgi:hypothetical protein
LHNLISGAIVILLNNPESAVSINALLIGLPWRNKMPSEKARSLDHFYELLATGQHQKIELDFDVAADDFLKSPPSLATLARGSPG